MTILLHDEDKTVELFIENLLWGKIKANFFRIVELTKDIDFTNRLSQNVYRWLYLHMKKECSEEESIEYYELTHELYCRYMDGRIDGTVEGELHDIEYDTKLKELETDRDKWKSMYEKSQEENKQLAQELHDQKNIIQSFEKNAYKQ